MASRRFPRVFRSALLAGLTILPLSATTAAADNAAGDFERRRFNPAMSFEPQSPWWGSEGQPRRERRGERRRPGGWWLQEQPRWWTDAEPRQPRQRYERDFEPEPEVVQGAEIYDYKPDPLVSLGDETLKWIEVRREPGDRLVDTARAPLKTRDPGARVVYDELRAQTSGVRVTEVQRKAIVGFYAARDFEPVWTTGGRLVERAKLVLELLSKADAEGLDAADYLPPVMSGYMAGLDELARDPQSLARLELGLTAGALRYAMHMSGGRIVPNRLSGYHDLKPPTVSPQSALRELAESEAPQTYLYSLAPVHPAYGQLRSALADLAASDREAPISVDEGPAVRPGEQDMRIPRIRARLAQLGDLGAPVTVAELGEASIENDGQPIFGAAEVAGALEEPPAVAVETVALGEALTYDAALQAATYDAALQAAVKGFQEQSGLRPDGIIGSRTVAALNAGSDGNRRQKIVASLERLRWLPRDLGAKHVLVNQAAFTASVMENGRSLWTTKVIVGKPNTQTAMFSDEIEIVEFNPYWGVPGSIIVHEMLPYLKNDPNYLDREGYEVVASNGSVIDSASVDWWSVSKGNIPVGVRQPPGPQNALGEVKFLFPNKHAIYMHDTPSKPLFAKDVRAYSHGCVRVENPRRFAELLLGWDPERIASEIETGQNQRVKLDRKVPVHLTYFTAWPDENGRIAYYGDVYDRDERLELAFGTRRIAMQ